MKVIDLLNKIANGNIPKRIIYDEYVYVWNNKIENYEREIDIHTNLNWDYIVINCLNEEVEILEEEKKIPEKLNYQYRNLYGRLSQHKQSEIDIIDTLNYVIDYLKSKGE